MNPIFLIGKEVKSEPLGHNALIVFLLNVDRFASIPIESAPICCWKIENLNASSELTYSARSPLP
jgi:hypothetical protein